MEPSGLNPEGNTGVNQENFTPSMSAGRGTGNMPLFRPGGAAPNIGWQNSAVTAAVAGISPMNRPALLPGCSTSTVYMNGAADQDAGSSIRSSYNLSAGCTQVPISILVYHRRPTGRGSRPRPPAMTGVSEASQGVASFQFAPSDFLSLGRASNLGVSDMPMNLSALAGPVNCVSEDPPVCFQSNGLDAGAPKTGSQEHISQGSSSSAAVACESHGKSESVFPSNTDETQGQHTEEMISLLAEGLTDHNMHKYQTPGELNDYTVLSTPAAFRERTITQIDVQISGSKTIEALQNEEAPAPKAKPRRKKHRAKVIREVKQCRKQKPPVTTPEVKSPNQKAKRSYVRKKRDQSSLEKCSGLVNDRSVPGGLEDAARSRAASVRRRLQFEFAGQGVRGDQLSTGNSNKDGFDMHRSATSIPEIESTENRVATVWKVKKKKHRQHRESESSLTGSRDSMMLVSCQAGGIKKKRSARVRRNFSAPIMDIVKNNAKTITRMSQSCMEALYESSCIKFITKKRSQKGRRHSRSSIQRTMVATGGLSNSLVPFDGQMIVPYERPMDLVRKKKPRAKVDLDFETTRVWNLLMGKATEPEDGTDVDKERWWQQEREVFQGRANSFIARMRLVQGDRHFSPWKGSVVDSVVGVYLTQNVSDHLSSSAYMALAASFPPGSVNSNLKGDVTSQDNEEIISTSAVGGINMFEFFDNSPRPDLGGNFEELSDTYEKIHVETKINTSTYELTKGEKYPLYSKGPNEHFYEHQETVIDHIAQICPDLSIELTASMRSPSDIQFQKDMSSSQSVIVSETILQSRLSSTSGNIYPPRNCIGGVVGAASQLLGSNFDGGNSLAGDDATTKELEFQRTKTTAVNDDGVGEHGIPSTAMMHLPFISVDRQQPDVTNEPSVSSASPNSSSDSPKTSTYIPVKLHCEASNLQQDGLLSATGGMIEETANGVDGFTSFNGGLDKEAQASKPKKKRTTNEKNTENFDWDKFRRQVDDNGHVKEKNSERRDSVDWEAVRCAEVDKISHAIRERGMNNILAQRIQSFLNRLVREHGSIDLEWLRDIAPDTAKDYLLSIHGLGLKSVECVRLLTLHHLAFPVDTNVGRICVRLGWVPIQPLPESLQLHLLELYPVLATIQKYLWPRLCKLDQHTLYELHYHMITFGKVFCTKSKPNCNACPLRSECRHFASAFARARLALPTPEEKSLVYSSNKFNFQNGGMPTPSSNVLPQLEGSTHGRNFLANNSEPIIEEPASPREDEHPEILENDIEDYNADTGEIPIIKLNFEAFARNLENCIKESNKDLRLDDIAKAVVAVNTEEASIPVPKLKNVRRLRTEHYVYELPDSHYLVQQLGLDQREPDDPSPYLLTLYADDIKEMCKAPKPCCDSQMEAGFGDDLSCQYCVPGRENQSIYVRGTILVPCRTAMKGSFPLNGTYFQVNEVFADHKSSHEPIHVVREQLWNLQRRMVYFGTSVPSIFKGLTTEEIQQCFWRGFVCVRGFDMETRAPKPLCRHLHLAPSKLPRSRKSAATEQNPDSSRASVS